jgi:hypothetical protein
VALAPECNASIVDASIQRMRDLREKTGQRQQIIAAACSVDHARQIRGLYEQRGLKAREIYSEMDEEKQRKIFHELETGQIDCIVQVQMLGEGFDHPPLGVAAVFRPFRSLSPYVQFVGRIMRVMFQDDASNPANHGYVVSHIGLNNDANWRDFRDFDLEDQQVFREWLEAKSGDGVRGDGGPDGPKPRRFDEDMLVHGEIISEFVRQSFLDPEDERIVDKILDAVIPGVGVTFRALNVTKQQVQEMLRKAQAKALEGQPSALPVSPQKRRQAARKRIADRPKSVAARILKDLKLAPRGPEIARLIPEVKGTPNLVAAIRLMHSAINERLGIGKGKRGEATTKQTEMAMEDLDAIGDHVRERIKRAKGAEAMRAPRDILKHVTVEVALAKRVCYRDRKNHAIVKGQKCLVISEGSYGGSKNYCVGCGIEILAAADSRCAALRKELTF